MLTGLLRRAGLGTLALTLVAGAPGPVAADDAEVLRSVHAVHVPDLSLVDENGQRVALREVLGGNAPVLVHFIFTSCPTICPVLSATFRQAQSEFSRAGRRVKLVSITIDPDNDTPAQLKEHGAHYEAGADWHFFTGSFDDIVAVLRGFDAYRGDKMSHAPLTFVKLPSSPQWVRLEGFPSAKALVAETDDVAARQ